MMEYFGTGTSDAKQHRVGDYVELGAPEDLIVGTMARSAEDGKGGSFKLIEYQTMG